MKAKLVNWDQTNLSFFLEEYSPLVIGLCSQRYPMDLLPGWTGESVGYHTADGKLYKGRPRGQAFGPKCQAGDKVGQYTCTLTVHKTL